MPSLKLTDAAYDADEQARQQGCISTWGVGSIAPKGWKDAKVVHPDLEGVVMPDVSTEPGPSHESGAYLVYDEFICYAVDQVRLRYLFRVKMDED
jgi:poly [ADP-ribose] polymerase 2/3/4